MHRGLGRITLIVFVTLLAAGCHARFKKFARRADAVALQVDAVSTPRVDLTTPGGPRSLVGVAADAVAAAESAEATRRLEELMAPDSVEEMVARGTSKSLGGGPPFAVADEDFDGTLVVEVRHYGIYRSGSSPVFSAQLVARVYDRSTNEEVYDHSVTCRDSEWIGLQGPGQVIGTAATIAQIQKMSDRELRRRLQQVIRRCSSVLISQMRQHAG